MSTLSVRRPLALLAVLGMVATLLFAVAGTASAADPVPLKTATFSACPDNADIPDPGFSDVPAGTFFYGSVSCLAYYGTTTGTTPDTYDPGADITRAQMALFLARGAAAAGVVLDSTPPDAGFTDISELSVEAQTAINALADAGIVKGKTATTYEPGEPVLRQQMALFLTRFLGEAVAGPGGNLTSTSTLAPFTDIGATTVEAHAAINAAWDLGIATGTTATTYAPLDNVNRGQMASFMTRMYAQANVRPAGVNVQAAPMTADPEPLKDVAIAITSRDANFLPLVNTLVDAWGFIATDTVKTPFLAAPVTTPALVGDCDVTLESSSGPVFGDLVPAAPDACKLQSTDRATDLHGNIYNTSSMPDLSGEPGLLTLYAWTGAVGALFNVNSTVFSTLNLTWTEAPTPPAAFTVKADAHPTSVATEQIAMFGDTVTWTVQLVDADAADAKPIALADVVVNVTDVKTVNGAPAGSLNTTVKTDATGMATYSLSESDPGIVTSDPTFDAVKHNVSFTVTTPSLPAVTPGNWINVQWQDEAAEATTIKVTTPTEYKVVDAAPATSTPNSVTVLVLDQYGDPFPGASVEISSDDTASSLHTTVTRTVDASGSWTESYTWNATTTGVEVLTAVTGSVNGTTEFVWATLAASGDDFKTEITFVDMDAKTFVAVHTTEPLYVQYTWGQSSSDHYSTNAGNTDEAGFAALMKDGVQFEVIGYKADGSTGATWKVFATPPTP